MVLVVRSGRKARLHYKRSSKRKELPILTVLRNMGILKYFVVIGAKKHKIRFLKKQGFNPKLSLEWNSWKAFMLWITLLCALRQYSMKCLAWNITLTMMFLPCSTNSESRQETRRSSSISKAVCVSACWWLDVVEANWPGMSCPSFLFPVCWENNETNFQNVSTLFVC